MAVRDDTNEVLVAATHLKDGCRHRMSKQLPTELKSRSIRSRNVSAKLCAISVGKSSTILCNMSKGASKSFGSGQPMPNRLPIAASQYPLKWLLVFASKPLTRKQCRGFISALGF